jgi:hypothetical protein
MLKLFCSYDSERLLKIWTEWVINCYIVCHFSIPYHVYYHCRSRIALRLRLRPNDAAPAPQHCILHSAYFCKNKLVKSSGWMGNPLAEGNHASCYALINYMEIFACSSWSLDSTSVAEPVQFCAAPAPACQKFSLRLQLGPCSPYN